MTKQQPSESNCPITVDEVAGWFPTNTRFGNVADCRKLDVAAWQTLAQKIEFTRSIFRASESDPDLVVGMAELPAAVKAAKLLKGELANLKKKTETYATGVEIQNLTIALDAFLIVAPGRTQGQQPSRWIGSAQKWAPLIAKCLKTNGKSRPSLSSETGPVTAVLHKAIKRVYNLDLDVSVIGRQLRRANEMTKKKSRRLPASRNSFDQT